ncbi:MAG: hypothetical protein ACPGLV_09095 [Bacteroidia bacterium]
MKTVKLNLIFILFIATTSCSSNEYFENGPSPREQHFNFKNECRDLGPSLSSFGFAYKTIGVEYAQPLFNPNDNDEIIFHEQSLDFSRLVKYRISTGERVILLDEISRNIELDWGISGWIALSNYKDMYILKEDGSSLQAIPLPSYDTGYSCAEPDFSPDGKTIGFPFGGVDNIGLYGLYLLFNIDYTLLL